MLKAMELAAACLSVPRRWLAVSRISISGATISSHGNCLRPEAAKPPSGGASKPWSIWKMQGLAASSEFLTGSVDRQNTFVFPTFNHVSVQISVGCPLQMQVQAFAVWLLFRAAHLICVALAQH
jgi:hypothetical protein